MQTQAQDAKVAIIFAWNFGRVVTLLTRDGNMPKSEALKRVEEYKKYMAINATYGVPHPISKEVDEVWHNHVLDTVDYAEFSRQIFGRFYHHIPIFDQAGQVMLRERYKKHTLPHLQALFGKPNKLWTEARVICIGEGGGGQGPCEGPVINL